MNNYNPHLHHRRSIRMKGYNYLKAGLYFITINCQDHIHRFGYVENKQMILNDFGQIAHDEWKKLPERFPNMELDVFQIMPNHMHDIIKLNDMTGAGFTPAFNNHQSIIVDGVVGQPQGIAPIGDIVGAYKSLASNGCLGI